MLKCNHDYTLFSRSWVCTSKISVAEKRLFFKIFQCGPSHAHDTADTILFFSAKIVART